MESVAMDRFTEYYMSVRPVLFLCRLCGLLPVGVNRRNSKARLTIRHSNFYAAARLIYLTVAVIFFIIWIGRWTGRFPKEPITVMVSLIMIYELFRTVNSYIKRRVLVRLIEELPDIDEALEACGVKADYAREGRENVKSLLVQTFFSLLGPALTTLNMGLNLIEYSVYCVELFGKSMLKHFLSAVFENAKTRFEKINLELLNGGRPGPLVRCHFRLSNYCTMVMKCYGFDYAFVLLLLVLHFGFQCSALYMYLARIKNYWRAMGPCIWIVNELVDLVAFVRICIETCRNANRTPLILHEMHNEGRYTREDDEEVHSISLKFLNHRLQLNCVGFCDIDYPLVFGIVTSIISYMMIYIQSDVTNMMNQRSLEGKL